MYCFQAWRDLLIQFSGNSPENLLRGCFQRRFNLLRAFGDNLIGAPADLLPLRAKKLIEMLPRLFQSDLRGIPELQLGFFRPVALVLQAGPERFDRRSCAVDHFVQRSAKNIAAGKNVLLRLRHRLPRHFGNFLVYPLRRVRDFLVELVRRSRQAGLDLLIPALVRRGYLRLRLLHRLASHALGRFFQTLAPLIQMLLRHFRRGKNFQRRRGRRALDQSPLHGFIHRLLQAVCLRLLRRLLGCLSRGLLGCMADCLLHRIADFLVEMNCGSLGGLSRLVHNRRCALRRLLHHLLHRSFGHALHRNLDCFLDGLV